MDCVFCKIHERLEEIIAENRHYIARYDIFPVSPGHTLIIPKRHMTTFFSFSSDEWIALHHFFIQVYTSMMRNDLRDYYRGFVENPYNQKSKELCQEALEHPRLGQAPDGYNIGVNEKQAAGQTIDHLHIHVIPRYAGDVADPTGGVRLVIPKKGNYKK